MMGSEHFKQLGFSSDERADGWVIWSPPVPKISLSFEKLMMNDKITRLLKEMCPTKHYFRPQPSLVQFWAIEQEQEQGQQHLYLTTFDQPFAVCGSDLYALREHFRGHRYRVDEGANEDELGAVGRVYRNKRLESSPDLRLYTTNEFPFRDDAHACGLRSYCALPIFDLLLEDMDNFYGVIEVFSPSEDDFFKDYTFTVLRRSIEAAQLRTTHLNLEGSVKDVDSEIIEMLQLATRVMPQMQMAIVWIPCFECPDTKNNLSCMKIAKGIVAETKNWNTYYNYDNYCNKSYSEECGLHHPQIGEHTMMSFGNKPRICQNVCDLSISENPLAHYARKAMLSFCFAVRLQSLHNSTSDFIMVDFFLHCNRREDEFSKSFIPLLLRVMEMKLKKYEFAYKGELGDELEVEVVGESSALKFETIKYKRQRTKELSMLREIKGCDRIHRRLDLNSFFEKTNLYYVEPSKKFSGCGWVFWSHASEEICENKSSFGSDIIQERIKCLMMKLVYVPIMQFWAPQLDGDKCYLEASEQPFCLVRPYKGLLYFRKQCMRHRYYLDENGNGATKEDKLGPPGRVFLNKHPEITPHLRRYSSTEFPLRDDAVGSGLTSYAALPIFKLNEPKCVGVLEIMCFNKYYLNFVGKILEAANLSSTHINFKPARSLSGNNDECRELASTEIWQACELFAAIPQLYAAEVWVPYNECPTKNSTNFCMERLQTTEIGGEDDPPWCQVEHVEIGKGIVGMALASESKSCFCRNSCEFSIADQPISYTLPRAWLDVCFAICLQSHHTDDLVYVLQFYLKGTCRREYTYFKTFLCSILQIMKQTLKSFKVASGQELGEKLVVEVIEFSLVSEIEFSEPDQADDLPVTFKFVNYRAQGHFEDKQVESVAHEERGQCTTATTNLKIKDTAKEIEGRKGEKRDIEGSKGKKRKTAEETKATRRVTFEMLKPLFGRKMKDVEKILGVHRSTIKRVCRENNMEGWPWNENHKNNLSIFMKDQIIRNLPPASVMADPQSSRDPVIEPKVDMVVIKAKYEDDTIRVELCRSEGVEKLMNEVGRKLRLSVESLKLKYMDEEDDEILLIGDDDLQHFLKISIAMDKPYIQVYGKVIPPTFPPRAVEFIYFLPSWIREYVVGTVNVRGDGHCGFRVVAKQMGFGEGAWGSVRSKLMEELRLHRDLYSRVFIEKDTVDDVMSRLDNFDTSFAPEYNWFMLPEMGHLVASTYNVILVALSNSMCNTFLPFRTAAPSKPKCICIGLLEQQKHFIEVTLHPGHPLPHIIHPWKECRVEGAATWSDFCQKQISLYHQLVPIKPHVPVEVISL